MKHHAQSLARSVTMAVLGMSVSASGYAATLNGVEVIERAGPIAQPHRAVDIANTRVSVLKQKMELFVRLDQPAVTEYVLNEMKLGHARPSKDDEKEQARKVDDEQEALRTTMQGMGAQIQSRMRVGANGFRIKADLQTVAQLRLLPGVKSVAPVVLHTPDLDKSVPWIKAPAVWGAYGDGSGVRVAIIDTGIDYLHANFGGSGDASEYAANNKNVIEAGSFPTAKVVGGYDFAGENYNANDPSNDVPQPDADPLDGNGHGSHVAGITAGLGVVDQIGPGVAKGASLYALKVFGDHGGSTALTADAIEWALDPNGDGSTDDHVDVINMSLGSEYGTADDPAAIAAQNATELGVIVVASAGNSGDLPYITGSPATARDVISVAASLPGPQSTLGLRINAPAAVAGNYEALEGAFTSPLKDTGPITGDVVLADPLDACSILSNAGDVAGKVVLIRRGACAFVTKGNAALNAGATAFVVYNNQPGEGPIVMGGSASVAIPSVMIGSDDGDRIAAALGAAALVNTTLDASNLIARPDLNDTMASFSSRGPGLGGSVFKPDLTAPGVGIVSTDVGTGTGGIALSGTSMSAPHVAGLSALMRPIFADLEPAQIKALLQNASVPAAVNPANGLPYPLSRQGVGVVRADRAAALSSFAEPAGLSFGRLNPSHKSQQTRTFVLHNRSAQRRDYTVTHVPSQGFAGIHVSGPSRVTVPAGGKKSVKLRLSMDPAAGPYDSGFYTQTEVDGWFVLDDGVDQLRVGYLAVVDPASKMKAEDEHGGLKIENEGASVGFAEGFTLIGEDGLLLDKQPNAIKSLGYRTTPFFGTDELLEFAVATERPWESASVYEVIMLIDADNDGVSETTLVAADLGLLIGQGFSGVMVTAIFNETSGNLLFDVDADFNNSSMVLPFLRHTAFGVPGVLPVGDTDFDYELYVIDVRTDSIDVQTGSVDLSREVVPQYASFGLYPDTELVQSTSGGPGDMLWLFQNNEAKKEARTVEVE